MTNQILEVVHHGLANVSRKDLVAQVATMYKADEKAVLVDGLQTQFGGGRTTGFAYVYDDLAAAKRYAPQHLGARVSDAANTVAVAAAFIGRL